MGAGPYNLVIKRGETYRKPVRIESPTGVLIDYSTSSILAMIRRTYDAAEPLVSLTCEWVNGEGIVLSLTAAQTAALPSNIAPGQCPFFWDLKTITGGIVEYQLKGTVKIDPEATK